MRRLGLAVGLLIFFAAAAAAQALDIPVKAAPTEIKYRQSTTISGRVSESGTGLPGQAIELQAKPHGAQKYSQVQTGATDASGDYAFTHKPGRNIRYRVAAGGSTSKSVP